MRRVPEVFLRFGVGYYREYKTDSGFLSEGVAPVGPYATRVGATPVGESREAMGFLRTRFYLCPPNGAIEPPLPEVSDEFELPPGVRRD